MGYGMGWERKWKQIASVQDCRQLQRFSHSFPPCFLLFRLACALGFASAAIYVEIPVLRPSCGAVGLVDKATTKLGVHLIQLPQRVRI